MGKNYIEHIVTSAVSIGKLNSSVTWESGCVCVVRFQAIRFIIMPVMVWLESIEAFVISYITSVLAIHCYNGGVYFSLIHTECQHCVESFFFFYKKGIFTASAKLKYVKKKNNNTTF